jgi:hypothetical protein
MQKRFVEPQADETRSEIDKVAVETRLQHVSEIERLTTNLNTLERFWKQECQTQVDVVAELRAKLAEQREILEIVDKNGCSCMTTDPEWHSTRCVIPRVKAVLEGK